MAFIKRILVPTDFSDAAKNALQYAGMLAKMTQAEVKLLHVFHIPVVDPYMPGDTLELLMREVKSSAEQRMKEFLVGFPEVSGECIHGFVIDDIISFAEKWNADLVAMGTTGASGAKEAFFGSNASGVISKSPIKVLAVPATYTQHKNPAKLCYASDFSGHEDLVFQTFVDLAKAWNSELYVVHVQNDGPVFTQESPRELFTRIASATGFDRLHFEEINSNTITAAVETYVQTIHADMLGMAPHRRNLLDRLFGKSRTKEIAHHTHIPLLSVHKH